MTEDEAPPSWQTLLLPPGVGAPMAPLPPASAASQVELDGLFPVDSAFVRLAKREFWLSTIHSGRINLQGAWEALGRPQSVAVAAWHTDPGVALLNADSDDYQGYETRKVGSVGERKRVTLPGGALHRLQVSGDGEQVLMAMAGTILVLLNPHWAAGLEFWDEVERKRQA